jgi:integrase
MSVYKRKGSPYYSYDFTFKGQRVRGCTKQKTKQLANIVEGDLMREARERGVEAILRTAPTLLEFSVEFIKWVDETHSIEAKTKSDYRNGWRLLKDTKLPAMAMDTITNHDCETITFPGSNYSANCALRTLRRMFAKAVEMKRLTVAPKIELRKVWGRTVAMSTEQAQLVSMKMKDGDPKDAFLVIRAVGARPKEVFSLRWEYVSFDTGHILNPQGKTATARRAIPLLGDSVAILKRRHLSQGIPASGWVFPSDSKAGHMTTINKAFTAARDAAGLPKEYVLYTARHGAMTDLAGVVSLAEVMKIGGHSDTKTAIHYQHPDTANLQAKLDEAKTNGRVM